MTKYKHLFGLLIILILSSSHECKRGIRKEVATGGSLDDMITQLFGPPNKNKTEDAQVQPEKESTDEEDKDGRLSDDRYNSKISIEVAKQVLDLSQKLSSRILKQSTKKFEVLSPISISAALHLALLGANGTTFDELKNLMGYKSDTPLYKYHQQFSLILEDLLNDEPDFARSRKQAPWKEQFSDKFTEKMEKTKDPQHQIAVANGIFVQSGYSIRPDYKSAVESVYKSELETLDFSGSPFEAAAFINRWVNDKTKGKIKELITGALNPETKVILTNALYFKALWLDSFIQGATIKRKFYPEGVNEPHIEVNLMAHGGKFPYYKDEECDVGVMGFPYQKNISTMYVFLPNDSSRTKLIETQKCLTADKMEKMIEKMQKKTAVVLFPRLHLTSGFNLKTMLKDLGVQSLFQADKSDLSLLSDGQEHMKRKMSSTSRMPEPVKNDMNDMVMMLKPPKMPIRGDDRDNTEDKFTFDRLNLDNDNVTRSKREVTYKVTSQNHRRGNQLRLKDFVLRKRMLKNSHGKKNRRIKRDFTEEDHLLNIEKARIEKRRLINPHLYAEEVIHKVDLVINERGTEGGAATAITLNRSGTNVVFRVDTPFIILIRHDPTRIPLFYGTVFEPVDDKSD